VFNQNNLYQDVEREIALSRRAFVLGVPTAISFGIVLVGERYGAMYELVESETISRHIARDPGQVNTYAKMMADLARAIHAVTVSEADGFPDALERLKPYIEGGIGRVDEALAERCMTLVNEISASQTLLHGDFHTGNVFLQKGEPLLIDMDRLSTGHPIAEISDLYYFYVILGENDPAVVGDFMGFPYETAKEFFRSFLVYYLETEDEDKLNEVSEKASLIGYSRLIRKVRKQRKPSEADNRLVRRCVEKISGLVEKLDTLTF
jgi:uncharacterized protein (TIGR02172 family)